MRTSLLTRPLIWLAVLSMIGAMIILVLTCSDRLFASHPQDKMTRLRADRVSRGILIGKVVAPRQVLKNKVIIDCSFYLDYLVKSDFTHSTLTHCHINSCELSSSSFRYSQINHVEFGHCGLENCDFSHAVLENVNCDRSRINNSKFNHCRLTDVSFRDAILHNTSFVGCRLARVNVCGADLEHAHVDKKFKKQAISDLGTRWPAHTVD